MKAKFFMAGWFNVRQELSKERRKIIGWASFLLPILIWCTVSYVPFVWHPEVLVAKVGDVDYFQEGMRIDKAIYLEELANMHQQGKKLPRVSLLIRFICQLLMK
jgi:NitT/TauT family transport system permease protein